MVWFTFWLIETLIFLCPSVVLLLYFYALPEAFVIVLNSSVPWAPSILTSFTMICLFFNYFLGAFVVVIAYVG